MIKSFLKIRQKIVQKKGFTLIEVLLASFIFTIVGLIAVTIFVNVLRIQKRISLENSLYEDARFMMERISREIRANAVDYEEYYNKLVAVKNYGTDYGCYANRFYQPGDKGAFGGVKYGSPVCSNGLNLGDPGCIIDQTSTDTPTGQNPYAGNINPKAANAFCDENLQSPVACNSTLNSQSQLYLINPQGTEKTILASKKITLADKSIINALSLLRLAGKDNNNDGIDEDWSSCSSDFDCPSIAKPLENTLTANISAPYVGFVPISPLRSDITSLEFIVAPLEDPRKAYAETTPDVQQQPHVTVLLTVKPSTTETQNYSGDIPSITLQSTVTSRVYNEVKSFYGRAADCPSY